MSEFTVGELRDQLKGIDANAKLSFAGGLTFYRIKHWGDNEFLIEFDEPEGYLSETFKKNNPGVKVVFMDVSDLDESSPVNAINIEVR